MWAGQWLLSASASLFPDLLGRQTRLSGASSSYLNCRGYPPVSCRSGDSRCVNCSCCQAWQMWNGGWEQGTGDRAQGVSMAAFPDLGGKGSDGLSDMDLYEGMYVDPGPGISSAPSFICRASILQGTSKGKSCHWCVQNTWMCIQTPLEQGSQRTPLASVVKCHLSKTTPFSGGPTSIDRSVDQTQIPPKACNSIP